MRTIRMGFPRLLLVFLLGLGVTGCSTTHLRFYEGVPRDQTEVALLKVQNKLFEPSARIYSLDGKPVAKKRAFKRDIKEVELLPGSHIVEVSYLDGAITSVENLSLRFTCDAGRVYDLRVAPIDQGFGSAFAVAAGVGRGLWTAWIEDAENREVLAGEPRTTPLRWYEK